MAEDLAQQADMVADQAGDLVASATEASNFLKAIAHDGRLMILCHLTQRDMTVTELEEIMPFRQAAVSQQLARLRLERLVESRREGKNLRYSIRDPRAKELVRTLHGMFCA